MTGTGQSDRQGLELDSRLAKAKGQREGDSGLWDAGGRDQGGHRRGLAGGGRTRSVVSRVEPVCS